MRFRPTYSNVTSTLALVLAVGTGGAWAATEIDGKSVRARSIPGSKLRENSITGKEVNEGKLAAVPSARTLDGLPPDGFVQGRGKLYTEYLEASAGTGASAVVKTLNTTVGRWRLLCFADRMRWEYVNNTTNRTVVWWDNGNVATWEPNEANRQAIGDEGSTIIATDMIVGMGTRSARVQIRMHRAPDGTNTCRVSYEVLLTAEGTTQVGSLTP